MEYRYLEMPQWYGLLNVLSLTSKSVALTTESLHIQLRYSVDEGPVSYHNLHILECFPNKAFSPFKERLCATIFVCCSDSLLQNGLSSIYVHETGAERN